MDTQNTPVHPKLWHKEFWFLSLANMLLTMQIYMLIPILPTWLLHELRISLVHVGLVMGAYGIGLFLLGPFCNFFVQCYRRNVVCILSIILMGASVFGMLICSEKLIHWHVCEYLFLILRMLMGATFGLAQMVLSSTLVIDASESFQRTEANHAVSWFGRFGMSLGPVLSLILYRTCGIETTYIVSLALLGGSIVFINLVKFPFKTPDDNVSLFSTDRFFLPHGKWLFLNLVMIMTVTGILLTLPHTIKFYVMLMAGFLLAIIAEKVAFSDADLKSEAVTGLILMVASLLMLYFHSSLSIVSYLAPIFIGFSIGIIGSRFLLFFIKLSLHCQRGTSQSTFFLAWELGISIGLFIGFQLSNVFPVALILTLLSLLMYNFFTHDWYVKHKNR